jgi:hypothetical protein
MKKAVITFNFGGHDIVKDPLIVDEDWDYICFTDEPFYSDVWRMEIIRPFLLSNKRQASTIKIKPFTFLFSRIGVDYDVVITMDANFQLTTSPEWLMQYIKNNTIAVIKNNNKIEVEADNIVRFSKDDSVAVRNTIDNFNSLYGKTSDSLAQTAIIVRRKSDEVLALDDTWLEMYYNGESKRDQLSFPYATKQAGIKPYFINWSEISNFCLMHQHK